MAAEYVRMPDSLGGQVFKREGVVALSWLPVREDEPDGPFEVLLYHAEMTTVVVVETGLDWKDVPAAVRHWSGELGLECSEVRPRPTGKSSVAKLVR